MAREGALVQQVSGFLKLLLTQNKHDIFRRFRSEVTVENISELRAIAATIFWKVAEDPNHHDLYADLVQFLSQSYRTFPLENDTRHRDLKGVLLDYCEREYASFMHGKYNDVDGNATNRRRNRKRAVVTVIGFLTSTRLLPFELVKETTQMLISDWTDEKNNLALANAEQQQTIAMQQLIEEHLATICLLRQDNTKLLSDQQEIKKDCNREKEHLIQSNAEQQQQFFELQQSIDEKHTLIEHLRQENTKLSNDQQEIKEDCNREKEILIQSNTEQQQKIFELEQSIDETHALVEHLHQENAKLSSEQEEIKEECIREKESLIQNNAEQQQKILELQQLVDERSDLIEHLRQEKTKLSIDGQEIQERLIHEKENLIQSNVEWQQQITQLQQSVDEKHALIEHLRQENAKLSIDRQEIQEDCIREKESLIQTNAEHQQKILEMQQSVDERHALIDNLHQDTAAKLKTIETLRVSMKEVETRLEERSAQNTKLENETIRLRGELSDMTQSLISAARTSSSESDAFLSPWEVISSDGASTQTTQTVKGSKKVRRSLKNRKSRPVAESFSIPETAGEYQD